MDEVLLLCKIFPMKNMENTLLRAIAEGKRIYGNAAGLSRASGVSEANISRWWNKKQSPRISEYAALLEAAGAQVCYPDEKISEYDLIPKVAARAGAGASLETDGAVEGLYAFRRDFMGLSHISSRQSVLMDVTGDSMEPLLTEGDTLLVDKSDQDIMDGKIYVVTLGDELRVKRIHKSLNGLILRSENPRYPDIPVEGPDLETFRVHGRVRWFGRVL